MVNHELARPFLTPDTQEYVTGSPRVAGLVTFPGKSMAPHFHESAFLGLEGLRANQEASFSDRQFMCIKPNGMMESQRTLPQLARLHIQIEGNLVTLTFDHDSISFEIDAEAERDVKVHTTEGIKAVDQGDGVAAWLTKHLGKELRFVRQVDSKPRKRTGDLSENLKGIQTVLRLQDSTPLTALSHGSLQILNQELSANEWYMEALSFRMNILLGGEFNEHDAVGKFIRFGDGPNAVYVYVWRPKERCPLPATDQLTGQRRGDQKPAQEKLAYVYQNALKQERMQDALGIPEEWRTRPSRVGGPDIPKAMIGIDMFPVNEGVIKVGDSITVLEFDQLPTHIQKLIR